MELTKVYISQQGSYCVLKHSGSVKQKAKQGGAVRGVVKTFSDSAKRRLVRLFSILDKALYDNSVFLTLTYGQKFPTPQESKRHMVNFNAALKRKIPEGCGIWKFEYQDRGAPHFHMIIFNAIVPGDTTQKKGYLLSYEWIQESWKSVIGDEYCDNSKGYARCPLIWIKELSVYRKAMSYLCKYISKKIEDPSEPWNSISSDEISPSLDGVPAERGGEAGDVSLNTSHILANSGRVWGYFNKKLFVYAARRVVTFWTRDNFYDLTHILCYIRSIVRCRGLSISWFSEDLDYFLAHWERNGFTVRAESVQI